MDPVAHFCLQTGVRLQKLGDAKTTLCGLRLQRRRGAVGSGANAREAGRAAGADWLIRLSDDQEVAGTGGESCTGSW